MSERIFTPEEAVQYLRSLGCKRVTKNSLAMGRVRKDGPEPDYDRRYVIYRESKLNEWARLRRRVGAKSTSTPGICPATLEPFEVDADYGDLLDYRDPDPGFDEITRLLEQQQEQFPYPPFE